ADEERYADTSATLLYCSIGNTKIAIMLAFHARPGSADGRRQMAERDGMMTDISLQKTAKTARRGRGRPFQRGQSGNPAGRPRGSSNRATRADELFARWRSHGTNPQGGRAGSAADPQRNRHPGYGKSDYRRGRARRHHSRRGGRAVQYDR